MAPEAAGEQGRCWEMHDTLYEHQADLDGPHVVAWARDLSLDLDRFKQSLLEGSAEKRVARDVESGRLSGVEWTPTFYVNGRRLEGSFGYDELEKTISAAMS